MKITLTILLVIILAGAQGHLWAIAITSLDLPIWIAFVGSAICGGFIGWIIPTLTGAFD